MRAIDNTDAEITAFDDTCTRLGGFNPRVHTEWVDGYLTAVAAGPRAVPLDEWLPRLCDDAFERAFADPPAAEAARAALAARMRALQRNLDAESLLDAPDEPRLQPLIYAWDDADRQRMVDEGATPDEARLLQLGSLWAQGFFDALQDFTADWPDPPPDDPDRDAYFEMLDAVQLLLMDEDDPSFKAQLEARGPDALPTREDLVDEACFAVQDLRVWWVDHAPKPPTRRVEAVPGRNDPCFCGSGQKYKKCHGRAA